MRWNIAQPEHPGAPQAECGKGGISLLGFNPGELVSLHVMPVCLPFHVFHSAVEKGAFPCGLTSMLSDLNRLPHVLSSHDKEQQ